MWAATDCIEAIDVWAGNLTPQVIGTIDVAALMAANPGIRIIIGRAYGGNSGPDRTYGVLLSQPSAAKVEPYLVINPAKSLVDMFVGWSAQIGSSKPKAIWLDCELTGDKKPDFITGYIKDAYAESKLRWAWAEIGIYTAPWWWNPNVLHGWEAEIPLWDAGYPYEYMTSASDGVQYKKFETMIAKLPIGNSFTPLIPLGWKGIAQPVIWQFSEKGQLPTLAPRNTDLNLVNRKWFEKLYGEAPIPVPAPITVEVRHPSGVRIVATEV